MTMTQYFLQGASGNIDKVFTYWVSSVSMGHAEFSVDMVWARYLVSGSVVTQLKQL